MNRSALRGAIYGVIAGIVMFVSVRVSQAVPTLDTVTQGNWVGTYGTSGYILPSYSGLGTDLVSLPSWISGYSYASKSDWVYSPSTTDVRAPQNPLNPGGNRVAAAAYGNGHSMTFNLNQAINFQLGVYAVDWDLQTRTTQILIDGGQPLVFNPAAQTQGVWGLWDLALTAGPHTIQVNHQGGPNSTIFAFTFSQAVPEPSTIVLWSLIGCAGVGVVIWRQRHGRR